MFDNVEYYITFLYAAHSGVVVRPWPFAEVSECPLSPTVA